jgi:hypothetical protein
MSRRARLTASGLTEYEAMGGFFRNALGMFSTTGLGALLASCSSGGEGTASAPMTEATVETVEGETATVSPQTSGALHPSRLPPPVPAR